MFSGVMLVTSHQSVPGHKQGVYTDEEKLISYLYQQLEEAQGI